MAWDFGKLIDSISDSGEGLDAGEIAGGLASFGASLILEGWYNLSKQNHPDPAVLAKMGCEEGLKYLIDNNFDYVDKSFVKKNIKYSSMSESDKAKYIADCKKHNVWKDLAGMLKEENDSTPVPCAKRAGGCAGQNNSAIESALYGRPLWPGLKAKTVCKDELVDEAKNQWIVYRPTMAASLCAPNLPNDWQDTANAPLPTPPQEALAPGWTPQLFAKAAAGLRASLLGVEKNSQPDENLKYFWAAVAKYAPSSAQYYLDQGVPAPEGWGGGSKGGIGGLTPVQLLLIAALAWYLLKGKKG